MPMATFSMRAAISPGRVLNAAPSSPQAVIGPSPVLDELAREFDLEPADEAERLATLTELFAQQVGRRPTAFRAGRFGAGPSHRS